MLVQSISHGPVRKIDSTITKALAIAISYTITSWNVATLYTQNNIVVDYTLKLAINIYSKAMLIFKCYNRFS